MLKLSKKGGYAVKAMIFIANKNALVKISDISSSEKIPLALLRRIISDLEHYGLVITKKGRTGGVELGKSMSSINLYDILDSIGEELGVSECTKGEFCDKKHECSTTDFLNNLQKGFNGMLKLYTLEKIIKKV